jgi:5-methylcytosine-specific restriction endonuclease McrA
MNGVFVISNTKQPLMPTSPARARKLLSGGKAAVFRRYPFTIILKCRAVGAIQLIRLKIDPGSKETGVALVNEITRKVVFVMVLAHRGQAISKKLAARRAIRSNRRSRKTRYRKPGLPNAQKPEGWLAPSLLHRVNTTMTWVGRLSLLAPVTAISQELVKFDLQKMDNPEISGIEYQQGTLAGYEVREYLLEKWKRTCVYCDTAGVPLQVEHVKAKANGGTNRISNLTLACECCNNKKGKLPIEVFLAGKPDLLKKIKQQLKQSLKDANVVNATRWRLHENLKATGVPLETGSGGRTKFNRTTQGYGKEHWIDAACVGVSGTRIVIPPGMLPLSVKANGHGSRQMCRMDRFGFPRTSAKVARIVHGFKTGDIVQATVPAGKKAGAYTGRVAVRATGSFNITTEAGTVQGISHKHCRVIHKGDGYAYQ